MDVWYFCTSLPPTDIMSFLNSSEKIELDIRLKIHERSRGARGTTNNKDATVAVDCDFTPLNDNMLILPPKVVKKL